MVGWFPVPYWTRPPLLFSRSTSSTVDVVLSWMPATAAAAAAKLLNTLEPNRNAIRESRSKRARLPPPLSTLSSHDGLMGLKSEGENRQALTTN